MRGPAPRARFPPPSKTGAVGADLAESPTDSLASSGKRPRVDVSILPPHSFHAEVVLRELPRAAPHLGPQLLICQQIFQRRCQSLLISRRHKEGASVLGKFDG